MFVPDLKLRGLQLCQLEILKEIKKVCQENGIEYILYGGTLLGAIRHKGFIPWDDDLDIAMLRKDYEKFLKIAPLRLPSYLFIQNNTTDYYPFLMTKIRDSRTTFIEPLQREMKVNHGVFVDIMVLDNVPDEPKKRLRLQRQLSIMYKLIHFGRVKKNTSSYNIFKHALNWVFSTLSIMVPLTKTIKHYNDLILQNANHETAYVGHTTKAVPFKRSYLKKDIMPTSETLFEGELFSVPNSSDSILKKDYGDYMTLPPEGQQHPNHAYYYDISRPYVDYLINGDNY
ncbi:MAG: LicD family protein [Sphaerochaeta sp.]|nr:LicD family protein [Sphaerochaeta sp.]